MNAPSPRFGNCGRHGDGCGARIEWRIVGENPDGSPKYHPFDARVDVPGGAEAGTDECHFLSCTHRRNFGKGYCGIHAPDKPAHVHEFFSRTRFDLELGGRISERVCSCGVAA